MFELMINYEINKTMRKISLITFDVNGTILTFRKSIGELYADAASKLFGIKVDAVAINANCIKTMSEMNRKHPNFGLASDLGWKNWWKTIVIKSFDYTISENYINHTHLEELSNYLIDRFATRHEYCLTDGSIDLFNYLHSKGVHLGIISNFDPRLHRILVDIGINEYFTFVITSYEAGFLKPERNIFKVAQETHNALGNKFHKDSTLHVGDSLKKDYYGAVNAGWNAVLISPFHENTNNDNNVLHFKNLIEFKEKYVNLLI